MAKIRHLEPYGFNEQPQFNGLANTVKANIESIKEKNQEQDKKDEEQDENIKQAIDKSVVSLELLSTPTEGSNRTYAVKQGGNEIGKIEIPFSSLVKSTTYDAENNLLIFTVDNDKEIKVDLTNLIKDSDLVQRQLFDDFKDEISSFSSNTVDSISELNAATSNTSENIKKLEQKLEDTSYTTAKALNKLNDDIEDFKDDANEKFKSIDKTFEDKSYAVSKAINELKDGLKNAIEESMVVKGTGENSTVLKNSDSIAKGKNSIALGTNLVTENENEIALGKYNNSSSDTVFSFGIGTSDADRKNAIEIKKDGNIYIWSEGKYVCLNEIIGRVNVNETY